MPPAHFLSAIATAPRQAFAIVAAERGVTVATSVELAADSAARRRGLLGRTSLAAGAALVIAPCNGVHTFGMAFAIDVVYTDRAGRIVKIRRDMRAGRMSFAAGAFAAIEMPAGAAAEAGIAVGDRLVVTPAASGL